MSNNGDLLGALVVPTIAIVVFAIGSFFFWVGDKEDAATRRAVCLERAGTYLPRGLVLPGDTAKTYCLRGPLVPVDIQPRSGQ